MNFKLNGLPINAEYVNSELFFESRKIFYIYSGRYNHANSIEFRKISKCNYIKGKAGGKSGLINGEGIKEWLQNTLRFNQSDLEKWFEELKNYKIIKSSDYYKSTKEINFFNNLIDYFSQTNKKISVKLQCVIGNYIVDAVINNTIVEYDENEHAGYNQDKEKERQDFLIKQGYQVIRINDKNSIGKNIGIITNMINL
jgi:hypothetical protein